MNVLLEYPNAYKNGRKLTKNCKQNYNFLLTWVNVFFSPTDTLA